MEKIKVRAIKPCYIDDQLRKEGAEFEVDEALLSKQCMERVDGKPIVTARDVAAGAAAVKDGKPKPAVAAK